MYHVYEDWTDRYSNKKKKTDRHYSFLGLYRKFSIADVFELIDFDAIIDIDRSDRQIDINTLFASFYGNSIFSIFYNDLKMLRWIA